MPTLTVSPNPAPPSTLVAVAGAGFANAKTRLLLDGVGAKTNIFRPRKDGTFNVGITVSSTEKTQTLVAQQLSGTWTEKAMSRITVLAAAGGGGGYRPPINMGPYRPWALPVTTGTVNVTGCDDTGATDVTACLQSFIDGVPDGRIIQFPAGKTYKISSALNPKGRNNLIIDGGGSTLNNVAAANGFAEKGYTASFFWTRWSETAPTHITIRNFVATGASPSPGTFQSGENAAFWHAMRGTYLELANITASGLFGDLMTLNEAPSYVWAHDNTITNWGRHMISVICGSNILFESNTGGTGTTPYGVFDIEPEPGSIAGISNCTFRNNVIGAVPTNSFFSMDGVDAGKAIADIVVTGNTMSASTLLTVVGASTLTRPQRVTEEGNSGTGTANITFRNVDTLTVRNNGSVSLSTPGCTGVVTS